MITYKDSEVTEDEYKEIQFAKYKIKLYKSGCMPRFVNDVPNIINYRPKTYFNRNYNLHKGQYKLYLSELDFLTDYADYNSLIIYVGAAAGHHINNLYDDFKHLNLYYHLYDTNYFDSNLSTKQNIKLFHEYFTNDHCNSYKNIENILFISDIRNMEMMNDPENIVAQDMIMQMDWVLAIQPKASMLKFRLPYNSDQSINYLNGDVRIQAYAPNSTNETRLVSQKPYSFKLYNSKDIENRMYYLNRIIRHWYEFDSLLEKYIIKKYKNKYG